MTTIDKINKATEILNAEGYNVNHKMVVFGLFQADYIEKDDIKSFIRINSKCNYKYNPDEISITFDLGIKKIDQSITSTEDNRKVANYILYICDVVDKLNALNIVLKRDLSELNL